ncbi:MAG TPA: phage tail protein I, partial [Microbacteriaceae bacterium]|nr:phage tail protein I [Microbacteriaceae bacterium]
MPTDSEVAERAIALLPPNATAAERSLSLSTARAAKLAVPHRKTWDPSTCPLDVLPWLAWALSVDEWDSSWPEEKKRAAVAASIDLHRRKGTTGAVRKALSALGYEVQINERTGTPYVFRIEVDATVNGMSDSTYAETERIALQQKNARSHLGGIDAVLTARPSLAFAAFEYDGIDTFVSEYWMRQLAAELGVLYFAAAEQSIDTVHLAVDASDIDPPLTSSGLVALTNVADAALYAKSSTTTGAWSPMSTVDSGVNWYAMSRYGEQFAAAYLLSGTGTLLLRSDGWAAVPIDVSGTPYPSLGPGGVVLIPDGQTILRYEGSTSTSSTLPTGWTVAKIAYAYSATFGYWLAFASSDASYPNDVGLFVSSDGSAWTLQQQLTPSGQNGYGTESVPAVGNGSAAMTWTEDGAARLLVAKHSGEGLFSFSIVQLGTGTFSDPFFASGHFVLFRMDGSTVYVRFSDDGLVWTDEVLTSLVNDMPYRLIASPSGRYIGIGSGGEGDANVFYSDDAITWEVQAEVPGSPIGLAWCAALPSIVADGDMLSDPVEIDGDYYLSDTFRFADYTTETGEPIPTSENGALGHTRWFAITASADGTLTASTAQTPAVGAADTFLAIYSEQLALLASNDDIDVNAGNYL